MRINKICWKNIYSYGNKVETLDFSGQGVWQLFGKSGSGKSSIIQMPQLLIYGNPMEKVKKTSIANRTNKHGVIRGEVQVGNDVYRITRKFSPDDIEVCKNGTILDFPTKTEAQAFIERVVANNLPLEIYKNVLTLSLNNFTSFITISAADKRKIIDNVFSMDIVNKCMAYLKEDKKAITSEINSLNGGINVIDGQIYQKTNSVNAKRSALSMSEEDLSREADIIEAIGKIDEKTPVLNDSISAGIHEGNTLRTDRSSLLVKKASLEAESSTYRGRIALFKQDRCPTCGTPFNTDGFENILIENEELCRTVDEAIKEAIADIDRKNKEIAESDANIEKTREELKRLSGKRIALTDWQNRIHQYAAAKLSIDESEEELRELEKHRGEKFEESTGLSEKYKTYELLESVYSDSGVKKYHREKYIPTLNAELKAALEFIDFPYQLSFDNDFNAQLKSRGEVIEIGSLSAGERKRVDMCVLCSLIRIIKQKYPTINIIALDETISSLDYESSVDILKYLKKISTELGVNILIVSHTTLDESLFDKRLFVDKKDGFSSIEEL